jgi:phenylpropionate dioxygenase-like ring-hydroxylating dioxygenase large terminal subunit
MYTNVSTSRDRIDRVLDHLREGTTDRVAEVHEFAPGFYNGGEVAEAERRLVFGRVPIVVAHGSEMADPGDFMTLQMPRNNVLLVRQQDRGVKAFVNVCRHRGARLATEQSGSCRLFSCGYHRWSYDRDGTLRAITRDSMFGDVDRSKLNLIELPAAERHGLIWLVDSVDALIDVEAWLGPEMDEILAGFGLDQLICFRAEGFDEPVNWRLMMDAFLDGYHIQYAHPNSAAKHVHTNASAFDDFGRHCRFLVPRKSIDRWIDHDPGDLDLTINTVDTHFIGPNTVLLRQPDHFQMLTFRPHHRDPGMCRMEMRLYVPPVEATPIDPGTWTTRWEKNWTILLTVLHGEDFPLLREAQVAVVSGDAGPMLLGLNEVANHVFHRELNKLMSGEPS